MIIKKINIDGFGIYNNYSCTSLSGGLNFFYGLNESGKSTLLAFIRACLFNMNKSRGKNFPYLPISGGKHGGNIEIKQNDKLIRIERYFGKKNESKYYDLDGNKLNENDVLDLLSLRNRLFFENIFAFGLNELNDLNILEKDEIKQYIYSTSLGVDSNLLRKSEKILTDNINEIFKPNGSKQHISRIKNEIATLDRSLSKRYENIDEYKKLNEKILLTKDELENKKNQLKNYRIEKKKLESYKEEYLNVLDYFDYVQELSLLKDGPDFDIELFEKYKVESKDYKNCEEQITRIKEKSIHKTEEMNALTINYSLIKNRDLFLKIVSKEDYVEKAISSLPKREEEIQNENNKINQIKQSIGFHWTEELIKNFDTTLDVINYVRTTMQDLEILSSDITSLEKDLNDKEIQLSKINDDLISQKEQLLSLNINNRDEYNYKLKTLDELKYLRCSYSELIEESKDLNIPNKISFYNKLFSKSKNLAIIALLLVILGFILTITNPVNWIVLIGIVVSIVSIVYLGLFIYFSTEGICKEVDGSNQNKAAPDIENIKQEMIKLLKLSLNENVDSKVDLNYINLKISKIEDNLNKADKCITEIEKHSKYQQTINTLIKDIKDELKINKHNELEIKNNWSSWLNTISVDDSYTPKTFIDLYEYINLAQISLNKISDLKYRINQFTELKEEYEKKLKDFLQLTGLSIDTDNFSTAIKLIDDILNEQTEIDNKFKHLKEDIKQFNNDLEDLESKKSITENNLADILVKTFSLNEDEIRNNVVRIKQRNQLQENINRLKNIIQRKASELNLIFDQFVESINNKNLPDLEEEIMNIETTIDELESSKEELQTALGSYVTESQAIMQDSTMSDLLNQKEAKIQELNDFAKEWLIDKMLLSFIEIAKRDYERDKQPYVITEANKVFNTLTTKRYSRIIKSLEDDELRIEDNLQRSKTIDQLSQGTKEQLYLALRFGYIKEYCKKNDKFPIIFDDIFVNFDPKRLEAGLKTLCELSKEYQILFLSCHPQIKECLNDLGTDYKLIELNQKDIVSI